MIIEQIELISKLNEFRKNNNRFQTSISIRSINEKKKTSIQMVLYLHDNDIAVGEIVLFERIFNDSNTGHVSMLTISNMYTDFFTTVNAWEIDRNKEDFDKWIDSKINSEAL